MRIAGYLWRGGSKDEDGIEPQLPVSINKSNTDSIEPVFISINKHGAAQRRAGGFVAKPIVKRNNTLV